MLKYKVQKLKRGYSDEDCYDLHYWLLDTFPQMVKTMRDMRHGAPELNYEEFDNLPLEWVIENAPELLDQKKEYNEAEELILSGSEAVYDKWWFILTRITYCLEQANEDITPIKNEYNQITDMATYNMWLDKFLEREKEIFQYREDMKNEAFDLLKKYFWNLWD
jgi:hypothetical protein